VVITEKKELEKEEVCSEEEKELEKEEVCSEEEKELEEVCLETETERLQLHVDARCNPTQTSCSDTTSTLRLPRERE
jgi:hypothetical protein